MQNFGITQVLLVALSSSISASESQLIENGHYRIRSFKDGLYASAGGKPSGGLELGEVTTEKWGNFREQRWDLLRSDRLKNEWWLFAQENPFNKLSARVFDGRRQEHFSELLPVTFGRYLISSSVLSACLINPGYGLNTEFGACDPNDLSQHWEFDLLTSQ